MKPSGIEPATFRLPPTAPARLPCKSSGWVRSMHCVWYIWHCAETWHSSNETSWINSVSNKFGPRNYIC